MMKSLIPSTTRSLWLLAQFVLVVVHSQLQPVPGYPNCFVQNPSLIGNNQCDNRIPYNTQNCGNDGLDCSDFNSQYPKCQVVNTDLIADGRCQNIYPFNTTACKFDGGDCDAFREQYPNCHVMQSEFVGDKECQDFFPYNTLDCGYDGGDCLMINKNRDWSDRYIGIGIGSILGLIIVFVVGCYCCKGRHKRLHTDPSVLPKSFSRHQSSHGNVYGLDNAHEKPYTLDDAKKKKEMQLSDHGGIANASSDQEVDLGGEGSRDLGGLMISSSDDGNDIRDHDDVDIDIEAVGVPELEAEPETTRSLSSTVGDSSVKSKLEVSSSSSSMGSDSTEQVTNEDNGDVEKEPEEIVECEVEKGEDEDKNESKDEKEDDIESEEDNKDDDKNLFDTDRLRFASDDFSV